MHINDSMIASFNEPRLGFDGVFAANYAQRDCKELTGGSPRAVWQQFSALSLGFSSGI
jgi:hypothetical protein